MTPIITYTCLLTSFWNNLWINYSVSFPNNPLQFSYVIGFTIVFISNTCQQYSLSLFLFLSSLQLLIHQFCSASVCLCCLSTFPLIRVTNIYWTLILCQTLCCVRDAKKKKWWNSFPSESTLFHCHYSSSGLCHLRPKLWP